MSLMMPAVAACTPRAVNEMRNGRDGDLDVVGPSLRIIGTTTPPTPSLNNIVHVNSRLTVFPPSRNAQPSIGLQTWQRLVIHVVTPAVGSIAGAAPGPALLAGVGNAVQILAGGEVGGEEGRILVPVRVLQRDVVVARRAVHRGRERSLAVVFFLWGTIVLSRVNWNLSS